MKSVKRTIELLKINGREVILFEIVYRILTNIIFLSLLSRGAAFAVKMSGYSYLTAKNIGWFLMKPFTLPVLAGIALVGVLFILVEVCTLLAAFKASEQGKKMTVHQIFIIGLRQSARLLQKGKRFMIVMALLLVVLSNFDLIGRGILHVKPLNDIVKNVKQNTVLSYTLLCLTAAGALAMLPGIFSVHFCVLNKKTTKGAMVRSRQLVKKNWLAILFQFILLNLLILIFLKLVLYITTFITAFIIASFVDRSITLALFLTAFNWLEMANIIFGGIISVILNMAFLSGMYYYYREQADMRPELLISEEEYRLQSQRHRKTYLFIMLAIFGCFLIFTYDVVRNGIHYAAGVLVETQITAHRGSSKEAPENTLPAVELAIAQMADFIEIDVQETMDGVVILMHDSNFKRTCGINKAVWRTTYKEVRKLDAGSYMGEEYTGTSVPTLQEVLELCKDKIQLNIELKNNGHQEDLVRKTIELVQEYEMEKQCVFTSTSLSLLRQVKMLNEELKTGYIVSTTYGTFYDVEDVDFFSANSGLLNERNVSAIHEMGGEVHAWTVNSKTETERMKRIGVDNIITDYPVLVRELLYREEDTESFIEFINMVLK